MGPTLSLSMLEPDNCALSVSRQQLSNEMTYRFIGQISFNATHTTHRYHLGIERVQASLKHVLTNISRSHYVAIATQPVHWLQIRPIVHNYHSPKLHSGQCNSVGMRPRTDRHTHTHTHTHRRAWPQYISRRLAYELRLTRNVTSISQIRTAKSSVGRILQSFFKIKNCQPLAKVNSIFDYSHGLSVFQMSVQVSPLDRRYFRPMIWWFDQSSNRLSACDRL